MKIGGLQKNSLIDFPATVACVVFTRGCNFFCPYCHNPDLVSGSDNRAGHDPEMDEARVFSFLEKRRGLLDGVVITGGEPCLHTDLPAFCQQIKAMGFKVKLDSNGSRPGMLKILLDKNLLDYVAMDVKTDPDQYSLVAPSQVLPETILESISLVMDQAPDYEFRTTCARPFVSPGIMDKIGRVISGARRYALAACTRRSDLLDPAFASADRHFFTPEEMEGLKSVASPYVETVIVR